MLCDSVLTKKLLNKASCSYLISTIFINIIIVLEKICFQGAYELFKNFSFIKNNVEEASKTEIG